jgi:hypothetical protein
MKVWVIIVVIAAIVLAGLAFIFIQGSFNGNPGNVGGKIMCGDPPCLGQHFPSCTPAEMSMSSGGQSVTVSILGLENGKCHFTMVFGNVTAANCYFKTEDLTDKVLNQMFGNKEGQDAIIAEACGNR